MPELPEVESLCRQMSSLLSGKRILSVSVIDPKLGDFQEIIGRIILRVERIGKCIVLHLDENRFLQIHLRMTGKILWTGLNTEILHKRMTITLDRGMLHLVDPRRFATIKSSPLTMKYCHVPDPLDGLKASELFQSAEKSNIAIKAFLMNQKKILGIGNIYACEILHAIGVNPFKKANRISIQNWKKLCRAAKSILQKATAQRGTTVSDWADLYGNQGTYQKYLKVYGREGCACCRCGMPIVRFKINGRGTYYCSTCQPE